MVNSIHIVLLLVDKYSKSFFKKKARGILLFFFSIAINFVSAQINYVQNPSFEILDSCNYSNFLYPPQFWDTLRGGGGGGPESCSTCNNPSNIGVPVNGYWPSFQVPKSGQNYCFYTNYYSGNITPSYPYEREYIQNKLIQTLTPGKTYCVKFWVSLMNESHYAITEFGAYLDNGSVSAPYYGVCLVSPQVKSPPGNFLTDTLNWIKIEGTYLASGNEQYLTLGNFKTTASTSYSLMAGPRLVADYYIDDVSIIDISTPAYAGPDRYCIPGDSVYIGRPSEVGLDDDCFWYELPNTITPFVTLAGVYVKPAITTTYVVKQDICGYIKSDTVVVYKSGVGLNEISLASRNSILYPNPNNGSFTIKLSAGLGNQSVEISIFDLTGRTIFSENKIVTGNEINMNNNLLNGSYILRVKLQDGTFDTHTLIINR